jgi:heme-degrading monooxygenase HmoA
VLYHISIHTPKPEHEQDVLDSMHRFGVAAATQPGLVEVHTLRDTRGSDALVGFAIWESPEALMAARPALGAATEGDDFDAWESEPIRSYLCEEI